MGTACAACGKDVVPKSVVGAAPACPECGAAMGGAAKAAAPESPVSSVRARAEFRAKNSVEAGAVFSKSMRVFLPNVGPFGATTLVVLSPTILYGLYHALRPLESITASDSQLYSTWQMILGGLLGTLVSAAIISGVFQHLRGAPVSFGALLSRGLARTIPALWTAFFAYFLMAIPMIPGLGLMLGSVGFGSTGLMALGGLLTVVGAVGVLIVSTALYVAVPASVVEKCNGWPAIKRSFALTKGSRGQIFVVLLAMGILGVLVTQVVRIFGGYRTTVLLDLAWSVAAACFGGVLSGVVYYHLRAAKEGIGIEELAKVFD